MQRTFRLSSRPHAQDIARCTMVYDLSSLWRSLLARAGMVRMIAFFDFRSALPGRSLVYAVRS